MTLFSEGRGDENWCMGDEFSLMSASTIAPFSTPIGFESQKKGRCGETPRVGFQADLPESSAEFPKAGAELRERLEVATGL